MAAPGARESLPPPSALPMGPTGKRTALGAPYPHQQESTRGGGSVDSQPGGRGVRFRGAAPPLGSTVFGSMQGIEYSNNDRGAQS